jgi:hypothetical protein
MAKDRTAGRALGILGIVLVVGGIVGGVALYYMSERRYDDAVDELVRAPVGCDTTLDFSETGTFVVYVETEGEVDEIRGDCDAPTSYSRSGELPQPEVLLFARGADEGRPPLDQDDLTYENDDFSGTSIGRFEIDETGSYVVRVTDAAFAADPLAADYSVTVGRDPDDVAMPLVLAAVGVLVGGVLVGLVLLIVSASRARRARAKAAAEAQSLWTPVPPRPPDAVTSPPVAPPAAPTYDGPAAPGATVPDDGAPRLAPPPAPSVPPAPMAPVTPPFVDRPPLRLPDPPPPAAAPAKPVEPVEPPRDDA